MEHALVFASIIVGVAVSDQIISLNRLLAARHHVRWDWIPLAVALLALLTNVQVWWALAQPDAAVISIGQFLPTLVELILLALLSSASLPDAVPDGFDLGAFYRDNAGYVWTLFALTLGWSIVSGSIAAVAGGEGVAAVINHRFGDLIPLAVMVGLIFARRRWLIAIGLLLLSMGPIFWLSRTLA
jgi:hypothetical protein